MESTPTRLVQPFDLNMSGQQWEVRNKYAEILLKAGATAAVSALPFAAIARAYGSDGPTTKRTLSKAPGFITVRQRINGKWQTLGAYYDLRVADEAHKYGPDKFYPQLLHGLAERIGTGAMVLPFEVTLPEANNRAARVVTESTEKCEAIDAFSTGKDETVATYHVPVARVSPVSISQTIEAMYKAKDNIGWDTLITTIVSIYHANTTKERVE